MKRFFCTIVSYSHLPYARALAESLRDAGNSEPLYVLVTDLTNEEAASEPHLSLLSIRDVETRIPSQMAYYFDAFELCNALKPFLIVHLFQDRGAQQIIYLDADTWITGSFAPVWDELDSASLLLTPHQLSPPRLDLQFVSEVAIADLGFLNGGFAGWRAGTDALAILSWLCERLPIVGFCDRSQSMFVDQKLLPLVLSYFPDAVRVLRSPQLNVAYWNAHERGVIRNTNWLAQGAPVVFFHMSGFSIRKPEVPCIYMSDDLRRRFETVAPWFREVTAEYFALLTRHTDGHTPRPYGFGEFDGVRLNTPLRRLLFSEGRIDRTKYYYWHLRIREGLRTIKRRTKNFLLHPVLRQHDE